MSEDRLTKQEKIILERMKGGYNNKSIAEQLFISIHTVKKHQQNIYRKLAVSNKIEAIYKMKN